MDEAQLRQLAAMGDDDASVSSQEVAEYARYLGMDPEQVSCWCRLKRAPAFCLAKH